MSEIPHILFLPRWYPNPEDPQLGVFIQKHAKAAAMHHQVTVIYPFGIEKSKNDYEINIKKSMQLNEVCVWYKKSNSPLLNTWRFYNSYLKAKKAIKLNCKRIDIAHVNIMAKTAVVAFLLKCFFGIPYLVTEQWSGYTAKSGKFAAKAGWKKAIWRMLCKHADFVITVSKFLSNAMGHQKMHKQFECMPNIVESIALTTKISKQNHGIKLLNVSDLVDDTKNISGLLHAFKSVISEYPTAQLNIVGGGIDEVSLKQLSISLGLNEHVVFHGRVTNEVVYQFMHETDVVVINSNFETFSVVAAEGLICGKPVIATDCGGPSEFINNDVGKLVPIANNEALANGIIEVIQNIENYNPDQLNKYAQQRFSYQAVGNQLKQFYAKVLN